jgi:hypothetical protein
MDGPWRLLSRVTYRRRVWGNLGGLRNEEYCYLAVNLVFRIFPLEKYFKNPKIIAVAKRVFYLKEENPLKVVVPARQLGESISWLRIK